MFEQFDYEVDLYGLKTDFSKEYVLTTRPCKNPLFSFDRNMKPHEMNVICNIIGKSISFAKTTDILFQRQSTDQFIDDYSFFYRRVFDTEILVDILKYRLRKKIKSIASGKG
jgi:hypothetical protein